MALRSVLKELQLRKKKFFLVEWHCDKMVTVVEEKHIRARDGPITKGKDYFVKYGSKFLEANVLATGTKEEIEKIELEHHTEDDLPKAAKEPAKKRGRKRKQDGDKENAQSNKKKKTKEPGKMLTVTDPQLPIDLTTESEAPQPLDLDPTDHPTDPKPQDLDLTDPKPQDIDPTDPKAQDVDPADPCQNSSFSSVIPMQNILKPNQHKSPNRSPPSPQPLFSPLSSNPDYYDCDNHNPSDMVISNQSVEYSNNDTAESTELLQARLDIHELQERVGILEHTLTSVLERLEQHEERLERQWHVSASQLQMPSPVNHSYNPPINTSSPQTPHRFLQPYRVQQPPQPQVQQPPQPQVQQPSQPQVQQPPQTPSQAQQPVNADPSPLPLRGEKAMDSALPSSEIKKDRLQSKKDTLAQNKKFHYESKAPTLALRLAKLTYFGEDVMARCTPNGCRDRPALPRQELYELKSEIFRLFPIYWCNPVGFEALWGNCLTAIEQGCKRMRRSALTNQVN
ncbi:uncharacterized protein LOC135341036 isoform X2 [Halichondria panicea]|uniref:uncharacterized protein LOC135341036 isoform X2 n=1 Tax=Halichondria panicea TaxID=6063 RepID=UPI00312B80C3